MAAASAVKALSVALSGDGPGYCCGETVSGQVLLELTGPLPLRALRLQASGRARAAWSEGVVATTAAASPSSADGCRLEAEVPYLDLGLELLRQDPRWAGYDEGTLPSGIGHISGGKSYHRFQAVMRIHIFQVSEQGYLSIPDAKEWQENAGGDDLIVLEAGKHEFPFSFQLPQQPLATSFMGKHGSIQYCVKATLEGPVVPNQTVKREFQVISHIDINSPTLLTPVRQSQEKMIGCWFFTSGPVSLSAKIERKGYCNGEAIPIYAEIENCSSRLIVPKAAIFQTQTYLASGKTKTFRQMVANVRGNHVASGSTDTWNGKTLKIPPVTPSILDCCIIRVEYSLAVYIHIPGAKKLMLELPLVIGTIPCTAFSSRNSSLASQLGMDMSWLALAMPEHPEAPPNYADVVTEEEFSRHVTAYPQPIECEELCCPIFAYIQEFRFQPPPLYSEVDPHPPEVEENQPVSLMA